MEVYGRFEDGRCVEVVDGPGAGILPLPNGKILIGERVFEVGPSGPLGARQAVTLTENPAPYRGRCPKCQQAGLVWNSISDDWQALCPHCGQLSNGPDVRGENPDKSQVMTVVTYRMGAGRQLQPQVGTMPTSGWLVEYNPHLAERGWVDWHGTKEAARLHFEQLCADAGARIEQDDSGGAGGWSHGRLVYRLVEVQRSRWASWAEERRAAEPAPAL